MTPWMIAWPLSLGELDAGGKGEPAADSVGTDEKNDGARVAIGGAVTGGRVTAGLPAGAGVGTLTMRMLPAASPSAPTTATASWCGERTTAFGCAASSSGAGLDGTRSAQPVLWSGHA